MFEQLAGKVLWNVLSKYFTEESLSKNNVSKSTQLGIWSGYVELQNLEVKQDIINSKLRAKGHPIELVHCVIRRVEITIPFAKLSSSSSASSSSGGSTSTNGHGNDNNNNGDSNGINSNSNNSFAAILVLDGVHVLFCTSFEFHDDELQAEEVRKRREALRRSERFAVSGKVDAYEDEDGNDPTTDGSGSSSSSNKSYAAMLRDRITSGLLQQIMDKLHIHIRDFHIRIEDSQPSDPWAFGLTLESMHVLHDADQERSSSSADAGDSSGSGPDAGAGAVSKVAQVNHFAAYWNSLEYGAGTDDVPIENTILHLTLRNRPVAISQSLDKCIARRGSMLSVPSRHDYIPIHSYILLPLDATMHIYLSLTPKDLRIRPALEIFLNVDVVSTQLRDFQCVQILRLYGQRKNFKFLQTYRRYRPRVSIMKDPKAWWLYAVKVVKYQLEESYLRWSWSRFRQVYASRLRYMELYERRIKTVGSNGGTITNGSTNGNRTGGSSPSNEISTAEEEELQRLEDGIEGGLSVSDIVLFRALVNIRVAILPPVSVEESKGERRSSWYQRAVGDLASEDRNTREEFDRLVEYLENPPSDRPFSESRNESLTFLSVEMKLAEVRTALFAPLHSTRDQPQRRRLQEKFFEIFVSNTTIAGTVMGDYNRWGVDFSVGDFVASEIRLDRSKHLIANRIKLDSSSEEGDPKDGEQENHRHLFMLSFTKRPIEKPDIDKELIVFLSPVEWKLDLDCQWITRSKEFFKTISTIPEVSKYWNELSLAHLNSLALGRLGAMAKAESAATNHENVLLDVHAFCPVIRIGVGDGCDLILDFGLLMLKTEKLAGVSRNKINQVPLLHDDGGDSTTKTVSDDYWTTSIDNNSLGGSNSGLTMATRTPTHTIRSSMQRLMFNSGSVSLGGFRSEPNGNSSVAGKSFFFDDDFSRAETRIEHKNFQETTSETLFYDTYMLQLQTGKFVFSGESELTEVSQGIEVRGNIQKSIIPSDHTICKMKTNMVVGSIVFDLNEAIISRLSGAYSIWKAILRTDVGSQYFQWADDTILNLRGKLDREQAILLDNFSHHTPDDNMSGGSEVNEEDFFDANEGSDLGGENSGIWLEDNWIADAESVIDGDSIRSSSGDRRGRRRQPSISDVSSTSDQSKSRRNQQEKGYLNAENLARLEENVGEDDSVADSGFENDDDSFHSVLTNSGQVKLIEELEVNIKESEEQMDTLRAAVKEISFSDGVLAECDLRTRRNHRRNMKVQLSRAEAELKAMKVLLTDLRLLVSDDDGVDDVSTRSLQRLQQANDAKAFLKVRRHRFSSDASGNVHNLTRKLKRQKFKGSVVFEDIKMNIQIGNQKDSLDGHPEAAFCLNVKQIASAMVLHENDTRLYFSIDQAVASLAIPGEATNDPCILFSGGSSDTLLPVHLPHLIAQSMEDRFVRGGLRLRKHGAAWSGSDVVSTIKLRLVVGDLEVSPYKRCVGPLANFMGNFRKSTSVENSSVQEATNDDQLLINKSSTRGNQENVRSYDLAVRFPSIRVSLPRGSDVVGALTVTEASIRVLNISSPAKVASNIDLRCSNFQLLDIDNLEGGRGLEVFGRRDPYSQLVQLRLRHQLLPLSEEGRWILGVDKRPSESRNVLSSNSADKVYVSGRINPLSIIVSSGAAEKLMGSVEDLKQEVRVSAKAANGKTARVGSPGSGSVSKPLQWRADVSIRRAHVVFQERRDEEKKEVTADDTVNKLSMAFSLTVSASDIVEFSHHCLSIQMGVTDISLLRYIDDWPILEPWSCLLRVTSGRLKSGEDHEVHSIPPMHVPGAEIESVVKRFGWETKVQPNSSEDAASISMKLSPLKINISAQTVRLLSETFQSFKVLRKKENKENSDPDDILRSVPSEMGNSRARRPLALQIHMAQVEIQLLREESGTRPISHANALLLFCLSDTRIDYTHGASVTASVLIRKSDLFDLSSGRGIRVIGEEPGATLDVPYFVQVKVYNEHHLGGPQAARVTINWGCIQCLALPSFVQSIIDFKSSLSSIAVGEPPRNDSLDSKKDPLISRLLSLPNDVNVLLHAQCETFEFIIPSQDVTKVIKDGETDPIGVVTFRWKASLTVAFGLDCLHPGSIPWLTLNQDGNFADDDGSLLKGFCHRYLDGDNCGLQNIFTMRSLLDVNKFQALRTNITQIELSQAMKYGYNPLPRVCFGVTQPLAGEQRITNPIDLKVNYRSAGATTRAGNVEMSQSVDFDAKFVDVLLYIQSGSSGGFTDAVRVTVKPILEKLKKKDKRRTLDRSGTSNIDDNLFGRPQGLVDIMKQSPTVVAVKIDGFLVTCVPGGASRLNESPFFKFEMSQLTAGVSCARLTQHQHPIRTMSTANLQDLSPRHGIPSEETKGVFLGAWVRCILSGHYHNRRLVAWEPFLEPWTATAQFGMDLSELLSWLPVTVRHEEKISKLPPVEQPTKLSTEGSEESSLEQRVHENGKSDRFRDLGRLLRSPFQTPKGPSGVRRNEESNSITVSDFGYLLLASMASDTFAAALFMSSASKDSLFSLLPTQDVFEWFKAFGMPHQQGNPKADERVSISFSLSDSRPLNFNLSGALLENASGAFESAKSGGASKAVPHLIQNFSGMTLRFQEVLDADRVARGEEATRTRLGNGSVIPLTLKRSLSQTCDPHRAYIYLELGSFEDMIGRVNHSSFDAPNGGWSKSSSFFFKTAAKIPVDAVGAHRFALDRTLEVHPDSRHSASNSRDVSWIIVRVKLHGSVKIVSIESPLMLKSAADADLVCEVRDFDGMSLLWRCLVPKDGKDNEGVVPVPADLVPFLHDGPYQLTVAALSRSAARAGKGESISVRPAAVAVTIPPSFSKEKGMINRGVVAEDELVLKAISPLNVDTNATALGFDDDERVYLSACGIRIGKATFSRVMTGVHIPEQRMLFFRSPLILKNFLSLPIAIQIRVKDASNTSTFYVNRDPAKGVPSFSRSATAVSEWEDLGVLDCGQAQNWTGSLSSEAVQIRVRVVGADGDNSRIFPEWSSPTDIPPASETNSRGATSITGQFPKMKLADADGVSLSLSVALETGDKDWKDSDESVIQFCDSFPSATRVVGIFVPYWIVDSTQHDLEYFAGSPISGQLNSTLPKSQDGRKSEYGHTLGLAELMDNGRMFLQPKTMPEFNVLMIGDENASRLTVRKRHNRTGGVGSNRYMPWSEPIPLQGLQNQQHDLTVFDSLLDEVENERDSQTSSGRLVLRSIVLEAPNRFGGRFGTKILHVVNRYVVSNETGRDIEIAPRNLLHGEGQFLTVRASFSQKEPLHIDDTQPIRFRFKEYGWTWSGLFRIRSNQREVTMLVRHKMKSLTMIVSVERVSKAAGTSILIFRKTKSPPFRLENHTMYPLEFGQLTNRMTSDESRLNSLLQYQIADYAWDEPEVRSRILVVKSSEYADGFLGRFKLDSLAPGTEIELHDNLFSAEIVGDGPTRVLRITESGLPRISSFREDDFDHFNKPQQVSNPITMMTSIKLSHGIGISLIDFSPRELVYIRLQDLHIEQKLDDKTEDVKISIAHIKVNNQLWVTPYPVLMKMGKQGDHLYYRSRRARDAVSISWRRSLNTHGGLGHLTLLDSVDINMEPAYINVDGELAGFIFGMIKHVTKRGTIGEDISSSTRDDDLKALLALSDATKRNVKSNSTEEDQAPDSISTAAVAAKLKNTEPYLPRTITRHRGFNPGRYSSRPQKNQPLSKERHKFHVERARISTAKVDISWSGPLPGTMSSLLFKALTFERLPIRLRPFSTAHSYGTLEDHLQILKSHYVSYGRVVDLLMGLSSNPTFLVRAVLYTLRESCVAVLDWCSNMMGRSSVQLLELAWDPRDGDFLQPVFDDGTHEQTVDSTMIGMGPSSNIVGRAMAPILRGSSLLLLNTSSVIDWFASRLKFGSRSNSGQQAARGQVRSRNPRLFAHLDGFDMLVDFVEGENAGKALLSRVRMGIHLGEGYFCHVEGARQPCQHAKSRSDLDPTPFILMLTSERILLLNGKLDSNFCSVVWEVFFVNTAYVEMIPASELSTFSYDEIIIWHLSDPAFAHDNAFEDGWSSGYAAGLEVMRPYRVFVPRQMGRQILRSIDHTLK